MLDSFAAQDFTKWSDYFNGKRGPTFCQACACGWRSARS